MPLTPSELKNLKTFSWYFSVLSGDPQDLQDNIEYAENLGKLISGLHKAPYSLRFLCSISQLDYSRGWLAEPARDTKRLLFPAECELVGRGELDPKYRNHHKDSDCYEHGIWLNETLSAKQQVIINPTNMNKLAVYVFLLIDAHRETIDKALGQRIPVSIKELLENGNLDDLIREPKVFDSLNNQIAPQLKNYNQPFKDIVRKKTKESASFFTNFKAASVKIIEAIAELFKMIYETLKTFFSSKESDAQPRKYKNS